MFIFRGNKHTYADTLLDTVTVNPRMYHIQYICIYSTNPWLIFVNGIYIHLEIHSSNVCSWSTLNDTKPPRASIHFPLLQVSIPRRAGSRDVFFFFFFFQVLYQGWFGNWKNVGLGLKNWDGMGWDGTGWVSLGGDVGPARDIEKGNKRNLIFKNEEKKKKFAHFRVTPTQMLDYEA